MEENRALKSEVDAISRSVEEKEMSERSTKDQSYSI
jgi:hypothetical protein